MNFPARLARMALATAILILLLPTMTLVAGLVALSIPGWPILRRTEFESGRFYGAYRFRLAAEGEKAGSVGGFLQSTGLDRLPSLINVATGDLSLRRWAQGLIA